MGQAQGQKAASARSATSKIQGQAESVLRCRQVVTGHACTAFMCGCKCNKFNHELYPACVGITDKQANLLCCSLCASVTSLQRLSHFTVPTCTDSSFPVAQKDWECSCLPVWQVVLCMTALPCCNFASTGAARLALLTMSALLCIKAKPA